MSNITINQENDFPYTTTALTVDTIEEFLDRVKNFFYSIGFYSYGERQIYNSCFIDYYSDTENGDPCFYFGQLDQNNYNLFGLGPCLYNESINEYYPFISTGIISSTALWFCQFKSIIVFNSGAALAKTAEFYPIVKQIHLNDGRKIFFFINQYRGDPTSTTDSYRGYKVFNFGGCLYFTDIKKDNQKISNNKKCIIFSDSPNTSYFQEIENTASFTNGAFIHGSNHYNFINPRSLILNGGYIPDIIMNKDFLLKFSQFYIGDEYYLEGIFSFSDIKNLKDGASSAGKVIKIENKEYIILYNQPGVIMNNVSAYNTGYYNCDPKGAYTASLIISTDSLEENEIENNDSQITSSNNNEESNLNISIINNNETHYHNLEEITPSLPEN